MFEIGKLVRLDLGYQGENKARVIAIDMKAWLEEFPGAAVGLMLRRPDEDVFYPAALEMDDGIIEFEVTRADVAIAGEGEAQIILTNEDDVELRSRIVKTKISASMSGTEVEAPPPHATWVGDVLNAAAQAEAAVEKMPSIGENGNWYAWDAAAGAYVDTGKPSRGKDGLDGDPGYTPQKGVDYFDGEDGEDGYTPVKGKDYFDGDPGYTPVKGKDYFDGEDGVSPSVEVTPITDGHRVTITDANGSKSFDVMNGKDGELTGDVPAGAAGGYYTPAVSSAGLLSWTPSKSDMPAVPSADIKGPKGDDGYTPVKGTDYVDGKDGTSVTVKGVSTSSADGGSNVVTFSDGKTMTVKNGSKGSPGDAGKDAVTSAVALTILSTDWTGDAAPYTATVACNGVTADNHIIVGAGGALTAEQQAAMAAAMIVCTGQDVNSITLSAFGTVPTIDLPVNVMIVG